MKYPVEPRPEIGLGNLAREFHQLLAREMFLQFLEQFVSHHCRRLRHRDDKIEHELIKLIERPAYPIVRQVPQLFLRDARCPAFSRTRVDSSGAADKHRGLDVRQLSKPPVNEPRVVEQQFTNPSPEVHAGNMGRNPPHLRNFADPPSRQIEQKTAEQARLIVV
jgi:hypothetical protein